MLPKTKTKPKNLLSDLTALVFGPSKIGKSTWCSKAESALFLATEPGLNALEVFQSPITCWDDLLQACAEIAEGKHDFKTIVIDTVDNAYKMCADYVCKKFKIEHESDLGYGKGYALINNEFQRVPPTRPSRTVGAHWMNSSPGHVTSLPRFCRLHPGARPLSSREWRIGHRLFARSPFGARAAQERLSRGVACLRRGEYAHSGRAPEQE